MWWPLAARLAVALVEAGCVVKAICPIGHSLRFVESVATVYTYRGTDSLRSLEAAVRVAGAELVVPCDDGVVWQLHELGRLHAELRPLIERSLGSAAMYPIVQSRARLLETAAELGVRVPETVTIGSQAELAAWSDRVQSRMVLKLDGTWGGEGVLIARAAEQAAAAYSRLIRPRSLAMALKRLWVDRDPLALWSWSRRKRPVVTAQGFIAGRPANTMFFAWRGELLAMVTVEVLSAQGTTGAATIVRLIEHEEIAFAARALAKRLELSGFHGLDFMLEHGTGAAYLLELNPRCTQLGHLPLPGQGSLAGALYQQLSGDAPGVSAAVIEGDQIAFFPQALVWNPKSPYLRTSYHDVPSEELALTRELLLEPWPRRRLVARIYHAFRSTPRVKAVEFEESRGMEEQA